MFITGHPLQRLRSSPPREMKSASSAPLTERLSSRRANGDRCVSFTVADLREGLNFTRACHGSRGNFINYKSLPKNSDGIAPDLKVINVLCHTRKLFNSGFQFGAGKKKKRGGSKSGTPSGHVTTSDGGR